MKKTLCSFKWFSLVSLMALLFLVPASSVSAAVFTVNSNGDEGDASPGNGVCATATGTCTLRAAIEENNALSGGNTISIPAMTITLGSMLTVAKPVIISGAGQGSTIIDGGSPNPAIKSVRGFYFVPYSGSHSLSGLTIQHMAVTRSTDPVTEALRTGNGAAILNEATLALTNVTVTSNQADQGGGIYNMLDIIGGANNNIVPSLTLTNAVISSNTATSANFGEGGGGLYNGGALAGTQVTITNNTANQGGGWYNNNPHNFVNNNPANGRVSYSVSLQDFTISGNSANYGGGIDNDLSATITLTGGTISGNSATTSGGGIYSSYDSRPQQPLYVLMTLTNVTISGNSVTTAGKTGGGILNIQAMMLNGVTLSGNSATYGAGAQNGNPYNVSNSMIITNTTVSANTGLTVGIYQARGGGIFNTYNGQLTLTNATITQNSAIAAGGIDNSINLLPGALVTLHSTIMAGNFGQSGFPPECAGTIGSSGYNLIGNTSGCTFTPGSGDLTNVSARLGPLQNNGGPTLTHALLSGSPALNAVLGGCPPPATDQRGITRAQGTRCDMGAFEVRPGIDDVALPVYLPLILKNYP